MLCSICKEKPATVHLTQIVGDKMQKLDLCEDCAKAKGVNDPARFRARGFDARPRGVAGNRTGRRRCGNRNVRAAVSRRRISKNRAGSAVRSVTKPLPRAWKVCSRRCTKARGTRARCRKRCAQSREQADRLKSLQKKLAKAIEDGRFRAGRPIARRNQTNHSARDGFDGDVSHGHPRISRFTR